MICCVQGRQGRGQGGRYGGGVRWHNMLSISCHVSTLDDEQVQVHHPSQQEAVQQHSNQFHGRRETPPPPPPHRAEEDPHHAQALDALQPSHQDHADGAGQQVPEQAASRATAGCTAQPVEGGG